MLKVKLMSEITGSAVASSDCTVLTATGQVFSQYITVTYLLRVDCRRHCEEQVVWCRLQRCADRPRSADRYLRISAFLRIPIRYGLWIPYFDELTDTDSSIICTCIQRKSTCRVAAISLINCQCQHSDSIWRFHMVLGLYVADLSYAENGSSPCVATKYRVAMLTTCHVTMDNCL